eukprot:SM000091S24601  [mRNA]  locus=s91:278338:283524:- [translate_table: standard]
MGTVEASGEPRPVSLRSQKEALSISTNIAMSHAFTMMVSFLTPSASLWQLREQSEWHHNAGSCSYDHGSDRVHNCTTALGAPLAKEPLGMHQALTAAYRRLQVVLNGAASNAGVGRSSSPVKDLGDDKILISISCDFLLIVVPTMFVMTVGSDWLLHIFALEILAVLVLLSKAKSSGHLQQGVSSSGDRNKPFICCYRSIMDTFISQMLTTCIAILAVDFPIFPRRYAKAETFGSGLMDLGVGSFVFANGIISKQARGLASSTRLSLKTVSPLLFLGVARVVSTKSIDYQEHVGEYGVHWNYFFTLAAVALITQALPLTADRAAVCAVTILLGYQTALSAFGWSKYLNSDQRGPGLLSLNKEGIASCLGYLALYLASVQIGRHMLQPTEAGGPLVALWRSVMLDALFWAATVLSNAFVEKVSRRTCNLAYVTWMLAQNLLVVIVFQASDLWLHLQPPLVLQALDANLLPVFLLANVLTGLVNLSMNTLQTSDSVAFGVLTVYIAVVTAVAVVMQKHRLSFKF